MRSLLVTLARRVRAFGASRRGCAERERQLRRALEASDAERRRIAADLHDGVVQSLAGASFSLAAAADRARQNGGAEHAAVLEDGAAATRSGLAELRTLLVKVYPPRLQDEGLPVALDDLAAPLRRRGVEVEVEVPCDGQLPPGVESLFFRVAQEAVRNVAAHADAKRVQVDVGYADGTAELVVADDGRGFDPVAAHTAPDGGHGGLRLLADLAREAGGMLSVRSAPGAGTRVVARVAVVADIAG